MVGQTKLNARNESGLAWDSRGFLREFFPRFADLLKRYKGDAIRKNGVVEAACLLANAFGVLSRIFLGPCLRVRTRASTCHARWIYTISP